jgi:hypothetical protein
MVSMVHSNWRVQRKWLTSVAESSTIATIAAIVRVQMRGAVSDGWGGKRVASVVCTFTISAPERRSMGVCGGRLTCAVEAHDRHDRGQFGGEEWRVVAEREGCR